MEERIREFSLEEAITFLKLMLFLVWSNIALFLLPIVTAYVFVHDMHPKEGNLLLLQTILFRVSLAFIFFWLGGMPVIGWFTYRYIRSYFGMYEKGIGRILIWIYAFYSFLLYPLFNTFIFRRYLLWRW